MTTVRFIILSFVLTSTLTSCTLEVDDEPHKILEVPSEEIKNVYLIMDSNFVETCSIVRVRYKSRESILESLNQRKELNRVIEETLFQVYSKFNWEDVKDEKREEVEIIVEKVLAPKLELFNAQLEFVAIDDVYKLRQ